MTSLWKYFWENDVDNFCRLLAPAGYSQTPARSPAPGVGSPSALGTSPRSVTKSRKVSGFGAGFSGARSSAGNIGKTEVNSRDYCGLTLLLRAASSTSPDAITFVQALLDHPAIDLYAQDPESGWNALHRALYHGNISVARLLLAKERKDLTDSLGSSTTKIGHLIKTKDHEGNSPFDLYNATIALRSLKTAEERPLSEDESDTDEVIGGPEVQHSTRCSLGEELFTFGSNNNLSLGIGHEDDRQYPERIHLERSDHLIRHLYHERFAAQKQRLGNDNWASSDLVDIPALVRNRPIVIHDVVLSKLHSAILTTDPISNLYITGLGRGGRLGLGDEITKLSFTPVQGGLSDKKVTAVALGQNHTLAVTSEGELWSWGSNQYSQLGYTLPPPIKPDEEPISILPRQVYGPLKKELVLGVAASSIHSVVHTGSSLFCWGKNVGQLGLMDADSRSLEVQTVPRKVAVTLISSHSSTVSAISAIDRATCCLFGDRSLVVFTSYGYKTINLQSATLFTTSSLRQSIQFSSAASYDLKRREIHQIASGGDTIAAITSSGDLFTMQLSHNSDNDQLTTSTTNPSKIKDAITPPKLVWNSRKDGVKSVGVGENGSVIISTQSGAVWRRIRRTKAQVTKNLGPSEHKRNDFKFQRVPYITDVVAVRSSTFGAYAAVRKDCDITRDQLSISPPTLWDDVSPLLPLLGFKARNSRPRENKDTWKFQNPETLKEQVDELSYEVLTSTDLEDDLAAHFAEWGYSNPALGTVIRSASNPELSFPVHSWVLSARSAVLRDGFQQFRDIGHYDIPDILTITEEQGTTVIEFSRSIDIIAVLNIMVYVYSDRVIPAWNFTRQASPLAYRYRQIRTDVMKAAARLAIPKLEAAARTQTPASRSMHVDFNDAFNDPFFFEDGDALLELDGDEIPVHSTMLCQRCPWFQGLFNGRSGGKWLESRRAAQDDSDLLHIDLRHMDPDSFHYVLQFLYADVGQELFDPVVADSIDDFAELVMNVMSIANELMLDRLSQICQTIIGRFVSTRNISTLLNNISACSVTEFKKNGLEYICLQMEAMLENHLLDDLDEDLLSELDDVVRNNQLARLPYARSGAAEILLHEQYPNLAEDIHEERQVRVKDMVFRATFRDDERRSSSYRTRYGSFDDFASVSPITDKTARQKSKVARNEPFSPDLRPKTSMADLMFNMEGDEELNDVSPLSPSPRRISAKDHDDLDRLPPLSTSQRGLPGSGSLGAPGIVPASPALASSPALQPPGLSNDVSPQHPLTANPWGSSNLPISRLNLRETLAESKPVQSALSAGLAAQNRDPGSKTTPQKLSQKERKKQLLQKAEQAAREEAEAKQQLQKPWSEVGDKKGAPWKKQTKAEPAMPMSSLLHPDSAFLAGSSSPKTSVSSQTSSNKPIPRRAASPDTRFSGQKSSNPSKLPPASPRPDSQPMTPHSKSYIKRTPKFEQEIGVPLADIIGQQQREQQSRREAVAKRSLQEIQQEQEFQEWWDQESRRAQEEEARRVAREGNKDKKKDGGRRGRGSNNKSKDSSRSGTAGAGSKKGPAATPEAGPSSSQGKRKVSNGKA